MEPITQEPSSRVGRYPVEEEIGRSATGVVYRGIHPGLRLPVAIKIFSGSFARDPEFVGRFKRETAAIAALGHPGLVRVYDVDDHQGSLCVVSEFVQRVTLRGLLANERRLPEERALRIIQQLLDALGAVHGLGIVHGHLKAENVLLSDHDLVRIADFGVSHLLHDTAYAAGAARLVHTGAYLSPEQVRGEDPTISSDIYATGAVLYELIDGQPPFTGTVPAVLHAHLHQPPRPSAHMSSHLAAVVSKALSKDPEARFQSCREFSEALRTPARETEEQPSRFGFLKIRRLIA